MAERTKEINPADLEKIQRLLSHPAIKHAWFCERLYGSKDSIKSGRFSLKNSGDKRGWKWQPWEVEKLKQFRLELIEAISETEIESK